MSTNLAWCLLAATYLILSRWHGESLPKLFQKTKQTKTYLQKNKPNTKLSFQCHSVWLQGGRRTTWVQKQNNQNLKRATYPNQQWWTLSLPYSGKHSLKKCIRKTCQEQKQSRDVPQEWKAFPILSKLSTPIWMLESENKKFKHSFQVFFLLKKYYSFNISRPKKTRKNCVHKELWFSITIHA